MRHLAPALGLAILFASSYARAEVLIIDVAKKEPRKGGKASAAVKRSAEVKLVLSDSDTSRNLAPELLKRLADFGYDVAPEAAYGALDEVDLKNTKAALRFELLRSGESCFVNGKAIEPGAEMSFWRWETGDDTQPCASQLRTAIDDFAKARPPANPKVPVPAAPAPAADSPVAPLVAPAPAPVAATPGNAPAPDAVPAPVPAPAAAPPAAAPPAQQLAGTAPIAPPDPVGLPSFAESEKKGCGCSSSGAPAGFAGLLLLSGALVRRRRS